MCVTIFDSFIHTKMYIVLHCLSFRIKKKDCQNFVQNILKIKSNQNCEASIVNRIESRPKCIVKPLPL